MKLAVWVLSLAAFAVAVIAASASVTLIACIIAALAWAFLSVTEHLEHHR